MKTVNPQIDIFKTLVQAEKAFNKCESADLLFTPGQPIGTYFVDKSKTAFKDWPNHYILIKTK